MATLGELVVEVGADVSEFSKKMKQVTGDMTKSTKEMSDKTKTTSKQVQGSTNKMSGSFKKMAGVLAGAFAVQKVVQFGTAMVKASAEAQALEAQYEQVFGELQDEATKTLNKVAGDMSILPNRLKPMFSQLTSQFKGLGYDTQDAMGMAETAMIMASDASAFYDKSLEDVQSSLNSFIKGNYEGGESIGLFANETQMASWASENLSEDWKSLDEAGKQLVRLKYAEAMQENAGVTGQASREADGYENVLGNVRQAWTDFMAVLGKPLLAVVIPVMKGMVTVLQGMTSAVQSLWDKFSQGGGILEQVSGAFGKVGEAIKSAFTKGDFTQIGEIIGGILPTILQTLLGGIPLLIQNGAKLLNSVADGMGMSIPELMTVPLQVIQGLITGFAQNLPMLLETGMQVITGIIQGIMSMLPLIFENAIMIIQTIITAITELLPMLIQTGIMLLQTLIDGLVMNLPMLIEAILGVVNTLVTMITEQLPVILQAGIDMLNAIVDGIVQNLPSLLNAVMDIVDGFLTVIVDNLPKIIEAGLELLMSLIDGIVKALPNLVKTIISLIQNILTTIVENLPKIIQAGIKVLKSLIEGIVDMLPTLIDTTIRLVMDIIDTIVQNLPMIIDAGIEILLALINGIIDMLPTLIDTAFTLIVEIVGALIKALPKIISAGIQIIVSLVAGLIKAIPKVLSAVGKIVKKIWNGITDINWLDLGKNIVQGLANGIGKFAGMVVDSAKNLAKKAFNGIKSFFGINSPSKLMRDEIGRWLPAGVAVGIERNEDDALDAVDHLNTKILTPFDTLNPSYDSFAKFEKEEQPVIVENVTTTVVELDGEVVGRKTEKYVSRQQLDRTKRVRRR